MSLHREQLTPTQAAIHARRQSFRAGFAAKPVIIQRVETVFALDDAFGPRVDSEEDRAFGPVVSKPQRPRPTINEVVRATCERFNISKTELISQRRDRSVVRPRQIAMYVARKLSGHSTPSIGKMIGKRDHTTVMAATQRIESMRATDPDINSHVTFLLEQLRPSDD